MLSDNERRSKSTINVQARLSLPLPLLPLFLLAVPINIHLKPPEFSNTYLERRGVTRGEHRPNRRAAQPPEGPDVGVRPAGVDHDERDEGATQAVEEGKNVVVAVSLCRG